MNTEDSPATSTPQPAGGQRRTGLRGKVLPIALVVGFTAAGSAVGLLTLRGGASPAASACTGLRPLYVDAAPSIAPAVRAVARQVLPGGCGRSGVQVRAVDAATGVGQPDVWIPDSSVWLTKLTGAASTAGYRSIAHSPVVLAVPAKVARALPASGGFGALAASTATATPVLLGAGDLADSAPAQAAMISLYATSHLTVDQRGNLAAWLQTISVAPKFAPAPLPALPPTVQSAAVAIPTSEQAVWAANKQSGAEVYAAVYPAASGFSLDFPFVVRNHHVAQAGLAQQLLDALEAPAGVRTLAAYGFRSTTGVAGPQLANAAGIDAQAAASVGAPSAAQAATAMSAFATVTKPSRLLAAIDVSGSMGQPVPGRAGISRIDLARAAAADGLNYLPRGSAVGLWRFSADLTPNTDYQELAPITPVTDSTRGLLGMAVSRLGAVRNGGTGLYDTVLAAVRTVRDAYDPAAVNTVVVLTDGKDEDDETHRIALSTLLTALRAERHSNRPVRVITIAYGPDSDAGVLGRISAASGGISYRSTDPRDLPRVFRLAIGQRLCGTTC